MSKLKHSSEKEPELPGIPAAPSSEIKLTLIGRSIFQFESYLHSDVLRRHFATNEYLNGLAQEKKSAQIRFGKIGARATFLSFILICYISGIRFNFNVLGFTIMQFPSILEITSLLTALALLATIFTCIDVILIDRILSHLCSTILGIDSPVYG